MNEQYGKSNNQVSKSIKTKSSFNFTYIVPVVKEVFRKTWQKIVAGPLQKQCSKQLM